VAKTVADTSVSKRKRHCKKTSLSTNFGSFESCTAERDAAEVRGRARCAEPNCTETPDRDARGLRHQCAGPVRRLAGRIIERQGDNACGDVIAQRLDPGRPRLVALSRTISARHTCFCGALRSLTRASNRRRSAGETVMDIPVRMRQNCTHRKSGGNPPTGFKSQI
jgi:hypothetical protein